MRHKYDGFLMLQLNVPHCHTSMQHNFSPWSQSPAYALLFLLFARYQFHHLSRYPLGALLSCNEKAISRE